MPFSPAVGALLAIMATAPAMLAIAKAPPPEPGAAVVVIVPPWRSAAAVVEEAGGVLLLESYLPNIASSYAPDGDHAAALRARGAWAVLNGDFTAIFCGS